MKKALKWIVAFAVVAALLWCAAAMADVVASGTCGADGDNLIWTLDSEGTLTISGSGAMDDYSSKYSYVLKSSTSTAPWGEQTYKSVIIESGVTTIGNKAFYSSELWTVTFSDTVVEIGESSFESCSSLSTLHLPDSVLSLGKSAFSGCHNLTTITLGNRLSTIGDYAFRSCYNSQLQTINIPSSVIRIGNGAFSNTRLVSVDIPQGVQEIGTKAFADCLSLRSITIPASVISIGAGAFDSSVKSIIVSDDNQSYKTVSGDLYNKSGTELIRYVDNYSRPDSFVIPDTVTTIAPYAFSRGYRLKEIVIPNSVITIGSRAFDGCQYLEAITIPVGVTVIENGTFYNCYGLKTIIIPDTVVRIGVQAFYSCKALSSVYLPSSVQEIGLQAFQYCKELSRIEIPDGVSTIENSTFEGCDNLTSVVLPTSIISIKYGAFNRCSKITNVYYSGSEEQWNALMIQDLNTYLTNAAIQYNYIHQHEWQDAVYTWADDNSGVIATRTCANNADHVETETVSVTAEVTKHPTCEEMGETTYTSGEYQNVAFAVQSKTLTDVPALGHAWGEPAYTWNEDHTEVTATRICSHDPAHVETETVAATSVVTKAPTCEEMGDTTYTANFSNPAFETQTKVLTNIEAIGHNWSGASYTWSADYSSVTASRTCFRDNRHVETETVSATDQITSQPTCTTKGQTTYTSNAFTNPAFTVQIKTLANIPAAGHTPVKDPAVPATCTETGLTEGSHCSVCGQVLTAQQVTPKAAHTPVVDPAVAPTDTRPGLTEGSHCSVCGAVITAQQTVHPLLWDISVASGHVTIHKYYGTDTNLSIPETIDGKPVWAIVAGAFPSGNCPTNVYIPNCIQSIGSTAFSRSVTVYCHEYSEADYWADEVGYSKVYVDNTSTGTFYRITMPAAFTMEYGTSRELGATYWPHIGSDVVSVTSSNPDVVSVSGQTLTANAPGQATITCKVGGKTATTKVTVHADPTDFWLISAAQWSSDIYIVSKLTDVVDVVHVEPEGAEVVLTWASSNESVATVQGSNTGCTITAKRPGTAEITATAQNGVTSTCTVTVCYPVTAVAFEQSEYQIGLHDTLYMTANVTTSNGDVYQNELVSFSSSNEGIGSTDPHGLLLGEAIGTVTVTATADNGISATTTVHVVCPDHEPIFVEGVAPTCTEGGFTDGYSCPNCGEIISGMEYLPALGHDYHLIAEAPADVGRAGYKLYECSRCGERYTENVPAMDAAYQLYDKTWKVESVRKGNQEVSQSNWGNFASTYLQFGANGYCTYKIINSNGGLSSGTSQYWLDGNNVIVPSINSLHGMSSSSATFTFNVSAGYLFWTPYISAFYNVNLTPDGVWPTDDYSIVGTWTADHVYSSATGARMSAEYWPAYMGMTVVLNADNTATVNGDSGKWTYRNGTFCLDGERNILQFNELGQMVMAFGEDKFLVLTRDGQGSLPAKTKLRLPAGTKEIEAGAFEGIATQMVVIPGGCTTIGSRAFANCRHLEIVEIPGSVTQIASDAFSGSSVTIIGPKNSYVQTWAQNNGVDFLADSPE